MLIALKRSMAARLLHINDPTSSSRLAVTIFGANSQLSPSLGNLLGFLNAQISFPTRTSSKWVDHLKPCVAYKNLSFPQFIDYNAPGVIDRLISNSNVVINLIGANQYLKDYDNIYSGNVTIPLKIAEACARNPGVLRLIHFSAAGADPSSPSTRLRTKWIGEQEVKHAYPSVTVFRPTIIFGDLDNFVHRLGFIHRMLGYIPIIDDGNEIRQPIHYHDIGLAAINALKLPESAGKTYELGGPHRYSMREVCEIIYNKMGIPPSLKSIPYKTAHNFMNWMPHVNAFARHMTLDMVQESKVDLVVADDALGIDKLYVRPISFPQNIKRQLADYQAKVDLTIEESEHGWNGGHDRYFDP